jgi:hypothetical protein
MVLNPPPHKLSSSQVATAAKSFAAAQFALSGFDVLEQATANSRFFFDMVVASSGRMMKISVHASFNGFWDFVDRYLSPTPPRTGIAADYHRAINLWEEHISAGVTCCLVQFEAARLESTPHIYLASSGEIAAKLHEKIEQVAHNKSVPVDLDVAHQLEGLPQAWRFSQQRIADMMEVPAEKTVQRSAPLSAGYRAAIAQMASTVRIPLMN